MALLDLSACAEACEEIASSPSVLQAVAGHLTRHPHDADSVIKACGVIHNLALHYSEGGGLTLPRAELYEPLLLLLSVSNKEIREKSLRTVKSVLEFAAQVGRGG